MRGINPPLPALVENQCLRIQIAPKHPDPHTPARTHLWTAFDSTLVGHVLQPLKVSSHQAQPECGTNILYVQRVLSNFRSILTIIKWTRLLEHAYWINHKPCSVAKWTNLEFFMGLCSIYQNMPVLRGHLTQPPCTLVYWMC